jgi:hypothetical protein
VAQEDVFFVNFDFHFPARGGQNAPPQNILRQPPDEFAKF